MTFTPLTHAFGADVWPVGHSMLYADKWRTWSGEIEANQIDLNNRVALLEAAYPVLDAAEGTDITDAVNAKLATLSTGSTLILPPRNYLVGKNTASNSGIVMVPGVGIHQVRGGTISPTANGQQVFSYVASATAEDFRLSGMTINNGGGYTSCHGIKLDGTDSAKRLSKIRLSDIDFSGFSDIASRAIHLRYAANTRSRGLFTSQCYTGIYFDICADTILSDSQFQLGTGYGIYIGGTAGAFDEGYSIASCTSNGQGAGFGIAGQDWGEMVGCSWTTCALGGGIMTSSTNWSLGGTTCAPAAAIPALSIDATCADIDILGGKYNSANYGIQNFGQGVGIIGSQFKANTSNDVLLSGASAKYCQVALIRSSSAIVNSILEQSGADYNSFIGNVTKGAISSSLVNSVSTGNIDYP